MDKNILMVLLIVLLLSIAISNSLDFLIVYSENQDFDISIVQSKLNSKIKPTYNNFTLTWVVKESADSLIQSSDKDWSIIDASYDWNTHYHLSQLAETNSFVHFLMDDYQESYNKWTYSLNFEKSSYLKAIINTLKKFNWTTGVFFLSEEFFYLKDLINSSYSNEFNYFLIQSCSNIAEIVNREVFNLGSNLYYLFTDLDVAWKIVDNLTRENLLEAGSSVLMNIESSYNSTLEGSLIITPRFEELTDSKEDHISCQISILIEIFENEEVNRGIIIDNQFIVKEVAERMCPNHFCVTAFSLVNVKNGVHELIADTSENHFSDIIFIGKNSQIIPSSKKKILQVGLNSGIHNPNGVQDYPYNAIEFTGSHLAISLLNEEKLGILENFEIQGNDFDCGATALNSSYQLSCINKNITNIGLFYIPPSSTTVLLGLISTFMKLNLTIPQIGARIGSNTLSSSANYPYFARVSFDATYIASLAVKMLYTLGWNSCALIHQVDAFTSQWATNFVHEAKDYKIDILNSPNSRSFPANSYYSTLKANYSHVFQEAINSNARLIVFAVFPNIAPDGIKMFYDLGMRSWDLLIYYCIPGVMSSMYSSGAAYLQQVKEVSIPSMAFEQPAYIGSTGAMVADLLQSRYGIDKTDRQIPPCWYFDALYLGALSLEFMIHRGQDYRNGTQMISNVRKQKFTGCSGKVQIDNGTNNRIVELVVLQNAVMDPDTGDVTISDNAFFRPTGSIILEVLKPLLYPGNTTSIHLLRVINGDCPFPDTLIRTFGKGRYLIFGICIAVGLNTALLTFYIWKKWWNIKVDQLTTKQEISIEDFMMGATVVIEFFQLLAMGPDITPINSLIENIGNMVSLDLNHVIKATNGVFWIFLDFIFACVLLWVILSTNVLLRLDEKFPSVPLLRFLNQLADLLMPVLGNLMFIPIVSVLLDVFVCDKSIGNNFTDSYMVKDCYQFCWKDSHIIYAAISGLCLLIYEPLAVFCRPLWQELEPLIHVKYTPLHLMAKTIFQVVLILMNKTVKRAEELIHGILFTIVAISFVIFTFKHKAYNYPRFSWWLSLSLIAVTWTSFLATINIGLQKNSSIAWIFILIFGYIVIAMIGWIVQRKKYPSLLFRKTVKNTSTLFKFAFSFRGKSSKIVPLKSVE
ncbi:unnamed protein product [Blepharisma stoltei]|uniref:Receptor ligand binding region domain-containing protein n=1 Tax=Blepharisma stoltei TaxID=1481888 RepID=A0AAU9JQ63_9CILI|nr:unnamed protein product [Blepharisma stoltei]